MQVIVDKLLISYERIGQGPTLLVLHGWADSSKSYRGLLQGLSKKYDVIVPDLPGFGGSQSPPQAWGLDDYAMFLQAFLQKLKLSTVFAVIGHSNGGAIAIRGIVTNRLNADRLVLLASAGIRGEYNGSVKPVRIVAKVGKFFTKPLPKSTKQKLRKQLYQTVGSDMLVAEHLQETFKKVVTDDVQADAKRLQLPTLIIYGEQDDQTPVRYGELFHELIVDSSLEVLPHAGHFLLQDRGADVIHLVQEFLT